MNVQEIRNESGELTGYKITKNGRETTVQTGQVSRWLRKVEKWIEAGNTPEPYVATVPPPKTQFTSGEYLDRFTDAEYDAVLDLIEASKPVRKYYDRLLASSYIDLDDPKTSAGLSALVQAGVITEARKAELLEPEVQS